MPFRIKQSSSSEGSEPSVGRGANNNAPGAFSIQGIRPHDDDSSSFEYNDTVTSSHIEETPSMVIEALQRQAHEYRSQLRQMEERQDAELPTVIAELVVPHNHEYSSSPRRPGVNSRDDDQDSIVQADVVHAESQLGQKPKRRYAYFVLALLVTVIGASVLSLSLRQDNDGPSPAPFLEPTSPPTDVPAASGIPPNSSAAVVNETKAEEPPLPQSFIWSQRGQTISGLTKSDYFGCSVALSSNGGILAVGAYRSGTSEEGQVTVFQYSDSQEKWLQMGHEVNGQNRFGFAVDLSANGDALAVGGNGFVQIFLFNGTTNSWLPKGSIISSKETFDGFGTSVALSSDGSVVAAGAESSDDGSRQDLGRVRVFKYSNQKWIQMGQDLVGNVERAHFGSAVALSSRGNIVAGSSALNDGEARDAHQVVVYSYNETIEEWFQLGQILSHDFTPSSDSQWSVAMNSDGTILATSGLVEDGNITRRGHVVMYQLDNEANEWKQMGHALKLKGRFPEWSVPVALSFDGFTLATSYAVTANDTDPDPFYSWVFTYDRDMSMWKPFGTNLVNGFGRVVALSSSGSVVAAGDERAFEFAGHVKVFELN